MAKSGNSFKSRLIALLVSAVIGLIFIILGTYLWPPLIIVGIVVLILGALLSDTFYF